MGLASGARFFRTPPSDNAAQTSATPWTTHAEMRESLELLPSWVLAQKAARMHQEPGLAWLERQAEAAERLLAERQAGEQTRRVGPPGSPRVPATTSGSP